METAVKTANITGRISYYESFIRKETNRKMYHRLLVHLSCIFRRLELLVNCSYQSVCSKGTNTRNLFSNKRLERKLEESNRMPPEVHSEQF